jgi:hypothetical protein
MSRQIVRYLATAGGMSDVYGILQIEMGRQRGKIVGIVIHVMPFTSLGRPSVSAAVMGDDSIAVIEEEEKLCVPIIGRKRPAMTENDGLTFAPVLVINPDPVFRCDHIHFALLLERFRSLPANPSGRHRGGWL